MKSVSFLAVTSLMTSVLMTSSMAMNVCQTVCADPEKFAMVFPRSAELCHCAQRSAQPWTQKPQDQIVGVGETARFVCKPSDVTQNTVWSKDTEVLFANGERFSQGVPAHYSLEDAFTLRISPAQSADQGTYSCHVQDVGVASADLTVLFPRMARTTRSPPVTTDICDYLCSIQLGGQACECSRPSLPGKK